MPSRYTLVWGMLPMTSARQRRGGGEDFFKKVFALSDSSLLRITTMAKRTIVTQYAPGVSFGVSGEGYKLEMEALATLESEIVEVKATTAEACIVARPGWRCDSTVWHSYALPHLLRMMSMMPRRANGTNGRETGRVRILPVLLLPLLLVLTGDVDGVSAQDATPVITPVVTPIETPYTVIDDESRTWVQGGAEAPLRGNGPLTGYAYLFLTRPHFLEEHLYLRALIAPVYATGEVVRDHWPTTHSALGFGLGGGLFAASHTEFRDGSLDKEHSFSGNVAEATLAYYLRGPKIAGVLPLTAQIRVRPTYVMYNRKDDTARRFRLPEDSALYRVRAGIRLGGVPPALFPESTVELSLWHQLSYRATAGRFGLPEGHPRKAGQPAVDRVL
jgi:hypothetical protein